MLRLGRNGLRIASAVLATCAVGAITPATSIGQTVAAPYADDYSTVDLGTPTGVPGPLGGLTVKAGDTSKLLIGGYANQTVGGVHEIGVTRDVDGHITGFTGTASLFSEAPNIDGGLAYGPGGVLFFTQYSNNALGQIEPGSSAPDKIVNLGPLGVEGSPGALQFVPAGFPGAGSLKLGSYSAHQWYDADVTPDGMGTYDVTNVTNPTGAPGGPEGIVYIAAGSPEFDDDSILMSQYAAGKVMAYEVDANGDPVLSTGQDFITGLSGAEGAAIDPLTGDFLFSTFGGGNRVIVVRGFAAPGDSVLGQGTIGNNNTFDFEATSDADGSNPAGTILFTDTVQPNTTIEGDVVCVRVNGSRAVIVYQDAAGSPARSTPGGIINVYDGVSGDAQKNGRLATPKLRRYRNNGCPAVGTPALRPILSGNITVTDTP